MEGYEDYLATSIIKEREYKRGWRAGYKNGYNSKEAELRIEREKEIEGTWNEHHKKEELKELVQSPKDESGFYSNHE